MLEASHIHSRISSLTNLQQFSYAGMTAMAHIVGYAQDNGNIPAALRATMSEEEKALRSLGSKCFMTGWYTYIGLIWSLKMNMLFFYKRVVNGLWVEKFILPAQLIVGATGTSILLLLGLTCRPFHKLFQVYPDPGRKLSIYPMRRPKQC